MLAKDEKRRKAKEKLSKEKVDEVPTFDKIVPCPNLKAILDWADDVLEEDDDDSLVGSYGLRAQMQNIDSFTERWNMYSGRNVIGNYENTMPSFRAASKACKLEWSKAKDMTPNHTDLEKSLESHPFKKEDWYQGKAYQLHRWVGASSNPIAYSDHCRGCGNIPHHYSSTQCTVKQPTVTKEKVAEVALVERDDEDDEDEDLQSFYAKRAKGAIKMPKRDLCIYSLCETRETHVIKACSTLHNRCESCGVRGHFPETKTTRGFVCISKLKEEKDPDYYDPTYLALSFLTLTEQGISDSSRGATDNNERR